MRRITTTFLCSIMIFLAAGRDLTDSIKNQLAIEQRNEIRAALFLELSEAYLTNKDSLSAGIMYAEKALDLAIESGDKVLLTRAYLKLGRLLKLDNRQIEAIEYFEKAITFSRSSGNNKLMVEAYFELGKLFNFKATYDEALNVLLKAREVSTSLEDKGLRADVINEIGGVHYNQKNYDKAYSYYRESLNIWLELKDSVNLAAAYNNIGEIHRLEGNGEQALSNYLKALEINKKYGNLVWASINHQNMGTVYLSQNSIEKAKDHFVRSHELASKAGDKERVASSLNSLGNFNLVIPDYAVAKNLFSEALNISREIGSIRNQLIALKGLSDVSAQLNDFADAYTYHKHYKKLSDSIFNLEAIQKLTQLDLQYQFKKERKIVEIRQQKRELKNILLISGLVFLLVIILLLYGRLRIQNKHSKLKHDHLELEKKHLQEELEFKNKELTTNVMYLVKKNELINSISENLIKSKKYFKKENQAIIDRVLLDLQSSVDKDIWKEFEIRFQQVHERFYRKLNARYPDLTANEKKLCAFLRLNMTTKEISAITRQSQNSIEVARTRLRKKLNISNKKISLVAFLSQI